MTFYRVDETVIWLLFGLFYDCLYRYILVYSMNEAYYICYLRAILKILNEEKLCAKFYVCEFWLEFVVFLAHVVTDDAIMVNLAKIAAVCDWVRPTKLLIFGGSFL